MENEFKKRLVWSKLDWLQIELDYLSVMNKLKYGKFDEEVETVKRAIDVQLEKK